MPKVAVFGSYPESLLNFRGRLLETMVNAGHEVHTISPHPDWETQEGLEKLGVKHHTIALNRTGLNPIRDMRTLLALVRLLKQQKPDNLLAYTIKPVIYGGMAARLTGTNFYPMITGLGYAFTGNGRRGRVLKKLVSKMHQLALHKARHTIFQNPDNMQYFKSQGLLKTPAKLVNGSGVDLSHYNQQPLPEKPRFLMISRLLKDKGVQEYAEAARAIRNTHPDVKFLLAGWLDDSPLSISRRDLSRWIAEGTIDFLGHLKDVRPALSKCTAFVLPSYYPEGIPRTVLEAMSTGRPIITTDTPGCRETVVQHKNGFLIPSKNVEALTEAMYEILSHPESSVTMGQESRNIAEERFDVHKVNQEILKTMELA